MTDVSTSTEPQPASSRRTAAEPEGIRDAAQGHLARRAGVREHGPLRSGATSPASVEAATNSGCVAAYAYDEADTVNVVQAVKGDF